MDSKVFDPASVTVRGGHFIDGRLDLSGTPRDILRPSDGQLCARVPWADEALVGAAVESAHRAFVSSPWATLAPRARAAILRRWADLLELNRVPLARLEALGSTRPVLDVEAKDITVSADCLRFFAEYADKLGGDVAATKSEHFGFTVTQPYGVVAAIAPWNYPLQMACWKVGPALAAGNAVVLKPSELTPLSALALAELAFEAGVPAGIFNVVQGDGATAGRALVSHPLVGKVTFTGSTATGRRILMASSSVQIRPLTLELGGKSAQVVFADAPDISVAASAIANGIFNNAGQVCVAGSRLIVQRSIAEPLIERLASLGRQRTPAPTWDRACTLSPIIHAEQALKIERHVEQARAEGAEAILGGRRLHADGGHYFEPTLLTGVKRDSRIVCEEVFGPVLTVQTFDEEEEALVLANDGDYGLNAGVFTSDLGRAMRCMRRLDVGTVWVNHYTRTPDFNLAIGGFKGSGIGKDLGREAVEQNLQRKSVLMAF